MKSVPICNQTFIRNAIISGKKRIDLRSLEEERELSITYGQEFGSCYVRLGQTIIFATTSCEISEPKIARPNEGLIELSLDLCSASEKWLDSYQRLLPDEGIHCLRLLERVIRDSRCVDMESLCLVSGEKVWKIKCHIICLNFDGNLCEASSIAAIASLSHFKRPEVTVSADKTVKIHTFDERNPLSLTILHFPFCVSFAFFVTENKDKYHMIFDPLECEEESSDANLIIGANSYRETVTIHLSGKPVVDSNTIIKCTQKAIERAKKLTECVKKCLESDKQMRSKNIEAIGFANAIRTGIISNIEKPNNNLLNVIKVDKIEEEEPMEHTAPEETQNVYLFGRGIAGIGQGGRSQWTFESTPGMEDSEESNDEIIPLDINPNPKSKPIESKSDDEEEEVMILDTIGFEKKN